VPARGQPRLGPLPLRPRQGEGAPPRPRALQVHLHALPPHHAGARRRAGARGGSAPRRGRGGARGGGHGGSGRGRAAPTCPSRPAPNRRAPGSSPSAFAFTLSPLPRPNPPSPAPRATPAPAATPAPTATASRSTGCTPTASAPRCARTAPTARVRCASLHTSEAGDSAPGAPAWAAQPAGGGGMPLMSGRRGGCATSRRAPTRPPH
jgi:hypothetical protein